MLTTNYFQAWKFEAVVGAFAVWHDRPAVVLLFVMYLTVAEKDMSASAREHQQRASYVSLGANFLRMYPNSGLPSSHWICAQGE